MRTSQQDHIIRTLALYNSKLRKQVGYNSDVRSRCGPGNAHFISIRHVSLPIDATFYVLGAKMDNIVTSV